MVVPDQWLLTGTIPTQIGRFTRFTDPHIGAQRLTGTLPSQLGLLVGAGSMALNNNKFTSTIPSELGQLGQTGGEIRWVGTDDDELRRSERLRLEANALSSTVPTQLGRLVDGSYRPFFDITSNRLCDDLPSEIVGLGGDPSCKDWPSNPTVCTDNFLGSVCKPEPEPEPAPELEKGLDVSGSSSGSGSGGGVGVGGGGGVTPSRQEIADNAASSTTECFSITNYGMNPVSMWLPAWVKKSNVGFCASRCDGYCNCASSQNRIFNATVDATTQWLELNPFLSRFVDFQQVDTWGPEVYSSCSAFDEDEWWGGDECSASNAVSAGEDWEAVRLQVVTDAYRLLVASSACCSVMIICLGEYNHKPYVPHRVPPAAL